MISASAPTSPIRTSALAIMALAIITEPSVARGWGFLERRRWRRFRPARSFRAGRSAQRIEFLRSPSRRPQQLRGLPGGAQVLLSMLTMAKGSQRFD
jgi:hypothetical protein